MVYCLKVRKVHGEAVLKILRKHGLIDYSFKIERVNEYLYIPVKIGDFEKLPLEARKVSVGLIECKLKKRFHVRTYKDYLVDKIPKSVFEKLPTSYDIVGEAIFIRLQNIPEKYWGYIGEALLKLHRNKKAVYAIVGETVGTERVLPLKLIAGSPIDKTVYVEHGCRFVVYIGKTYVNPSLSYEHKRISEQVLDCEKVLDMFAGIGCFSILIAKYKKAKVYAVDINPYAIKSIIESMVLNKLKGTVIPILADSSKIHGFLHKNFDRIIMNLPGLSHNFIKYALNLLSDEGGIIHYYRFAYTSLEPVIEFVREVPKYNRRLIKVMNVRRVLEASPTKSLYVVDFYVT